MKLKLPRKRMKMAYLKTEIATAISKKTNLTKRKIKQVRFGMMKKIVLVFKMKMQSSGLKKKKKTMKMKNKLNQNKLQKLFQVQAQLKMMMMTNQRNSLSIKDIVKQVKDQTLRIRLTSKLIEKKKLDAIEDKSKKWLGSLTKKLVLDQMMKRKMTL